MEVSGLAWRPGRFNTLTLKDRIRFLTTPQDVDDFLATNPQAVVFKAGTCHKTQETFSQVQPAAGRAP